MLQVQLPYIKDAQGSQTYLNVKYKTPNVY